ncbi:MAG: hypothetical protein LUH36_04595 [Oscillospiraceae bacterium]|nr:hypothetical protein [Oscillospiraceae bacterium]
MMTIHAGIGYIDPLGEGYYYAGMGFDEIEGNEETIYVSDWMDANFGCSLFCVYSLPDGDIYAWDGIYGANAKDMANYMSGNDGTVSGDIYSWQFSYATILDTSSSQSETGTQSALFTLIVDGTGDFENVTGILSGHSATCDPEGWGLDGVEYDNNDPLCNLTLMEGCLKVPASSAVVTSGHYANDAITD